MARQLLAASAGEVLLADSVTEVRPEDAGRIVVSASHAGRSAVAYAVPIAIKACFFNDAGIGKDSAGVAGLELLGCPAAAYSHSSARIGDAADGWANGVLSAINQPAASAGLSIGQTVQQAVAILRSR
jgi:hypothetical protein